MEKQLPDESAIYLQGLMLLTIILAASSFPVGAAITNKLSPEIMMFLRFFLAAFLFLPYVLIKNGFSIPPTKKLLYYLILSIPLAVFFWCMFESLRFTSVLNTGALYTIVPAITAICAFLINRELTGKRRSIGLIIGTVGALWIVFRGDFDAFITLKLNYGDYIFLLGCLFLGLYNPLVKRFYSGEPMEIMTFWVLFFGSMLLLIVSGATILEINWSSIGYDVYGGIFYLSLFSTLITFFLLHYCTVRIGATKVAAYGFLTPVFVIIISVLVGIDEFEIIIIPGLVLIIGAMILIQRDKKIVRE